MGLGFLVYFLPPLCAQPSSEPLSATDSIAPSVERRTLKTGVCASSGSNPRRLTFCVSGLGFLVYFLLSLCTQPSSEPPSATAGTAQSVERRTLKTGVCRSHGFESRQWYFFYFFAFFRSQPERGSVLFSSVFEHFYDSAALSKTEATGSMAQWFRLTTATRVTPVRAPSDPLFSVFWSFFSSLGAVLAPGS